MKRYRDMTIGINVDSGNAGDFVRDYHSQLSAAKRDSLVWSDRGYVVFENGKGREAIEIEDFEGKDTRLTDDRIYYHITRENGFEREEIDREEAERLLI